MNKFPTLRKLPVIGLGSSEPTQPDVELKMECSDETQSCDDACLELTKPNAEQQAHLGEITRYIKVEPSDSLNYVQNVAEGHLAKGIKIEAQDDIDPSETISKYTGTNSVCGPGVQTFHCNDSVEVKTEVQGDNSGGNVAFSIGAQPQEVELVPGNVQTIKYEYLPEECHTRCSLRSTSPITISDSDSDLVCIKQEPCASAAQLPSEEIALAGGQLHPLLAVGRPTSHFIVRSFTKTPNILAQTISKSQSSLNKESAMMLKSPGCPESNRNTITVSRSQTGRFKCKICLEKFKDEQKFLQHEKTYHASDVSLGNDNWRLSEKLRHVNQEILDAPHVCRYSHCQERFRKKQHLISHERSHRQSNVNEGHRKICEFCGKTVFGKYWLAFHIEHECGRGASEKCSKCGDSGHAENDCIATPNKCLKCGDPGYIQHECPGAKRDKFYQCGHCNTKLVGKCKLTDHSKEFHHGTKPLKCKYCLICFFESGYIKKHKQTHYQAHACEMCKQGFPTKTHYDEHIRLYHVRPRGRPRKKPVPANLVDRPCLLKPERYKCRHCEMKFVNKVDVRRHARNDHDKGRPFKCKFCSMRFSGKMNFLYHKRAHFPHVCKQCKKRFRKTSELDKHVLHIHLDGKPFKCPYCDLRFYSEMELSEHELSHTECSEHSEHEPLPSSSEMASSSGIGPLPIQNQSECLHCGKQFRSKGMLNRHLLMYPPGENHGKGFSCELCKMSFLHKRTLKGHMRRLHEPKSQFKCKHCRCTFSKELQCTQHEVFHRQVTFKCMFC